MVSNETTNNSHVLSNQTKLTIEPKGNLHEKSGETSIFGKLKNGKERKTVQ